MLRIVQSHLTLMANTHIRSSHFMALWKSMRRLSRYSTGSGTMSMMEEKIAIPFFSLELQRWRRGAIFGREWVYACEMQMHCGRWGGEMKQQRKCWKMFRIEGEFKIEAPSHRHEMKRSGGAEQMMEDGKNAPLERNVEMTKNGWRMHKNCREEKWESEASLNARIRGVVERDEMHFKCIFVVIPLDGRCYWFWLPFADSLQRFLFGECAIRVLILKFIEWNKAHMQKLLRT